MAVKWWFPLGMKQWTGSMRDSLSETEARTFLNAMVRLINELEDIDGKPHHVALMIFTREGEDEETGEEIVSSDVLSTTSGEHFQELLHKWILRKTQ